MHARQRPHGVCAPRPDHAAPPPPPVVPAPPNPCPCTAPTILSPGKMFLWLQHLGRGRYKAHYGIGKQQCPWGRSPPHGRHESRAPIQHLACSEHCAVHSIVRDIVVFKLLCARLFAERTPSQTHISKGLPTAAGEVTISRSSLCASSSRLESAPSTTNTIP